MERSGKRIHLNDRTVEENSKNDIPTSEVLNDDCLLKIFQYLAISDRVRIERVNKRWRSVSERSWKNYKELDFTNSLWGYVDQQKITYNALKKVLRLCGRFLNVLDMHGFSDLAAEKIDMSQFLQFCPNLISVDFRTLTIGVALLKSLIKNCKNIVELRIHATTRSVNGLFINQILSRYTNLRVLNISYVRFPIEGQIDLSNNNSIEELSLTRCSELNIDQLSATISSLQNLRKLQMVSATFSSENQIDLSNKNSIEELSFIYCYGLNIGDLFAVIPSLQNFRTLSLRGSIHESGNPDFLELTSIKVLDISSNSNTVDDNFLIKIASAFAGLTSLNVGGNSRITDEGIRALTSLHNIYYLEITYLDISWTSLSDFQCLKVLVYYEDGFMKNDKFQLSFTSMDKLEVLNLMDLRNCNSIIRKAIDDVKSRTNDIPLVIFGKNFDSSLIKDLPDNLKLFNFYDEHRFNNFRRVNSILKTVSIRKGHFEFL